MESSSNTSLNVEFAVDQATAESFTCCICLGIPHPDVLTDHGKCGGVFCVACIKKWVETRGNCPRCKAAMTFPPICKENNRAVYSLVSSLKVKCTLNDSCGWVGEYSALNAHVEEEKKKIETVFCPFKDAGCKKVGSRKIVEDHILASGLFHAQIFDIYSTAQKKYIVSLIEENKGLKAENVSLINSAKSAAIHPNPLPPKKSYVFLDITVEGVASPFKLVFELFDEIAPKTTANFKALCIGGMIGASKKPLHYKGSTFHRIMPGFMAQGGDFIEGDGRGGDSIYGNLFEDENFILKHSQPGILSMANVGKNTNGSQFFITFVPCPWLDGKNVVFGHLISGIEHLKTIENCGTPEGQPSKRVTISESGEWKVAIPNATL